MHNRGMTTREHSNTETTMTSNENTASDCPKCTNTGPFHKRWCEVQQREMDAMPKPLMSTRASMLASLEGPDPSDGYVDDEDGCYGDYDGA